MLIATTDIYFVLAIVMLITSVDSSREDPRNMIFCLFVAIPFILDVKLHLSVYVDTPAGVTQEEGHTGVFFPSFSGACLNFLSREGFSRSFPSSTVKSNFVYPRHNSSPLCWA